MINTVASASGEIVSLEEAKAHLGVWDSALDTRVASVLKAARAYCERWAEITLQKTATRSVKCDDWPTGWVLKWPPVTAVTSITYYDADNVSQSLNASFYRTHLTEAGFGIVEWADESASFTLPQITARDDAVTVTYTTGWGESAPDDLKAAILLVTAHLFMEDDTRQLDYAKNAAMALLSGRAAWSYR